MKQVRESRVFFCISKCVMNKMVVMQTYFLHCSGHALNSASLRCFGDVYRITSFYLLARGAA